MPRLLRLRKVRAQLFQPGRQTRLPDEDREHAAQVRPARGRESGARTKFNVFMPVEAGVRSKAAMGTGWVLTWKRVDGERDVKARLVAERLRLRAV